MWRKNMVTLTLAVPEELKNKMDSFPEMNWSEVARQAFLQKLSDLEFLREFKSKSKLTEQEALKLGRELSKKLTKKYS
jgi:hypothetical protein